MDSLLLVHLVSGSGGLVSGSEGNETEATAATGLTVLHDNLGIVSEMLRRNKCCGGRFSFTYGVKDLAVLAEGLTEGLIAGGPGEVSKKGGEVR